MYGPVFRRAAEGRSLDNGNCSRPYASFIMLRRLVMSPIRPSATSRRPWRFIVRWLVLFLAVCVVWFVIAAIQHLIALMTGPSGLSITDEFPPVRDSGIVLAVCMAMMFQSGLLNHGATSDIDATNLTTERIAAWTVGAGLLALSWLLSFTVQMASDISASAAWAFRSVRSIAVCTSVVIFYYAIASMTAERRRRSGP